jgi:hypothetical protein
MDASSLITVWIVTFEYKQYLFLRVGLKFLIVRSFFLCPSSDRIISTNVSLAQEYKVFNVSYYKRSIYRYY